MKTFFNRFNSIAFIFSLAIIFIVIDHLIAGHNFISTATILQTLIFVTITNLIDFAFSYTNFKSYKKQLLCEFIILYCFYLFSCYIFKWFSFTLPSFIEGSLIFIVVYLLVFLYYYRRQKLEADEINKKLHKF